MDTRELIRNTGTSGLEAQPSRTERGRTLIPPHRSAPNIAPYLVDVVDVQGSQQGRRGGRCVAPACFGELALMLAPAGEPQDPILPILQGSPRPREQGHEGFRGLLTGLQMGNRVVETVRHRKTNSPFRSSGVSEGRRADDDDGQ